MLELLLKVVPLGIASTMSPGIFAVTLMLLSGKFPKSRTLALLLGGVLTVAILAFVGSTLGNGAAAAEQRVTGSTASLDTFLGFLMLVFGIAVLRETKTRERINAGAASRQLLKWFVFGFLLTITNFDAVMFYITAVKEMFQVQVAAAYTALLVGYSSIMFLLPTLLPLAVYIAMPATAKKVLDPIGVVMEKYGRYIAAAIFFIFGIYLLSKGLS